MNVWKCKLIFPTDTLQQKIETTDLKPFFVGENTSGLRLLHSTAYVCMCIYLSIYVSVCVCVCVCVCVIQFL